ncbi:MAG: ABC transporter permease [Roseburia sp.]|nr:ABC transporter permease [Roseburia sp.]
MANVLKKIPLRKAIREKGKSICVTAAVFFTTVLFVTVFSTLFFILDAGEEMMRASSPMLMDASLSVTEEEYERISQNHRVSESGVGIRLGIMREPSGAGGIQLYHFEEKMTRWMRYYPTEGRMPERGREIVLSDQYLRERGIPYRENQTVDLTYYIEDKEYTDTFILVGKYDMALQPLHVVLTSEDFYREVCEKLEERGIKPEESIHRMAGLMFTSRRNVRKQASLLMAEEGLDLEEGEIVLNDVSLLDSMGPEAWGVVFCLVLVVMIIGHLFISTIFQISISRDARFYGKLATNGVTKREIKKMIHRENNMLFLISAIPALLFGYIFSAAILPGILSGFTTIQVKRSGNLMIFVLSLFFSYGTVKVSERKPVKLAKNSSPIEMKKYMGKFRRVKRVDNGDCLKKFVVRHFMGDKKKVLKVCISIALSIFIANAFFAVAAGFDEEEYVKEDLDADFILAKKSILTSPGVNTVSYPRTGSEEIARYKDLPGIKEAGGGTVSLVCLLPSQEVWDAFVKIAGNSCDTPGEMYTQAYGLDDMMLKKLEPIEGEIDLELFHTGEYVLLDPIMSDNNPDNAACYKPGDKVTIPFLSGDEGTYTVMAVVENLPASLDFPGRYYASNLYLPMKEWQKKEKRKDYYMYVFDVEEEFHQVWEETLAEGTKGSLLDYKSEETLAEEAKVYVRGLKMAGVVLSMILLSMGILNFINCTAGEIYTRRKEFAIFQSMGMEKLEMKKSLAKEGMLYILGGYIPGVLFTVPGVYFLLEKVLLMPYIKYHIYPSVYLLFALLGGAAAVLAPWISYERMNRRENFLERIRS